MKHNWEYKPFKQLSDILYGCPFESEFFNSESKGMPLIRIRDVKPGYTSTYFNGGYSDDYIIKKGDYLIGMDGEFNIAPWQSEDALLNQRVCRVKSINENVILSNFIYYFLGKELKDIEAQTSFVTVKHLSAKVLNAINTPVPPMEVQEQIVAELDTINETIEDCRELLRNLDALAQSLFYDFFGDPVSNPKKWPVKRLKALTSLITNGTTPKGGQAVYVDRGITFLRSQNVWRDRLVMDDVAYLDEETNATMKGSMLHHNDILITKTGRINTENSSLGRSALFTGEDNTANINGHVYLVRLNGTLNPRFVLTILLTESYRDLIRRVCVGAIDKRQLNLSHIEQFPIILPPLELQEKFSARVEQINEQKKIVENTIAELQTLLDSRMDYWFN